jgi:hypothetical protein
MSPGCCVSGRTDRALSRRVAQDLADRLNSVLNRTVSDSRLSVRKVADRSGAFELSRVVAENDTPLELNGVPLRLFVKHVVTIENGRCRTNTYSYRLQPDGAGKSWLIRWEYARNRPTADYVYPLAHVYFNGNFQNGTFAGKLHVPTNPVGLGLVIRHLVTDWDVKPRTDDWESILEESTAQGFDQPV